jgi:hypothetical protein
MMNNGNGAHHLNHNDNILLNHHAAMNQNGAPQATLDDLTRSIQFLPRSTTPSSNTSSMELNENSNMSTSDDGASPREMLKQIEYYNQRESELLQMLKTWILKDKQPEQQVPANNNAPPDSVQEELKSIWEFKSKALSTLISRDDKAAFKTEGFFQQVLLGNGITNMITEPSVPVPEIKVEQAPIVPTPPLDLDKFVRPLRVDMTIRGNVVANKYLEPPVNVYLADEGLMAIARQGRLRVTASLVLTLSETVINKTLDNKQEILQGQRTVVVQADGIASFSKLKIMEVSSKHQHQAFIIQFQLEYADELEKVLNIGEPVKSAPLHVQSRINKRKRVPSQLTEPESPVKSDGSASSTPLSSPIAISKADNRDSHNITLNFMLSESPSRPRIPKRAKSSENMIYNPNQTSNSVLYNDNDNSFNGDSPSGNCTYVDITELLVLPQKEAAAKLGISESMLCKRFKECTRRKWPYRYLRKIDKLINMLKMHRKSGTLTPEDQEKLERLTKEREECLRPVRIRITGHDRASFQGDNDEEDESPEEETNETNDVNDSTTGAVGELSDEDDLTFLVETLGALRRTGNN